MRALSFLFSFFVLIGSAGAQVVDTASPLSGVWVPGELLQALQAQAPRQIPCYLVIEPSPLEVLEECGGGRSRWSGAVLEVERAGRLEVRAGERRRLIFRAGAPNELELVRTQPGQEPEMVRFYRLPAALEEQLRSWAAAQQILVGSWRTEDGAEAAFMAEGTYSLAQEHGAYRLSPGSPVAGSWGVLQLLPEGGQERLYLLTGAGRRLGLALPPAHLVPRLRADLAGTVSEGEGGAGGQERGVPAGQERGVLPGQGAAGAPGERPGAGGAGGGGVDDAEPQAGPSLEVAFWLERTGPGVEQQATAPSAPEPEPEAPPVEGKEPAPITQPIEPASRCGCSASEGVAGLGLLVGALALRRRRQHDASAPAGGERQP